MRLPISAVPPPLLGPHSTCHTHWTIQQAGKQKRDLSPPPSTVLALGFLETKVPTWVCAAGRSAWFAFLTQQSQQRKQPRSAMTYLSAMAHGQPVTLCQRLRDHRASEIPCPKGEGDSDKCPCPYSPPQPCVFHTSSKRVKFSPLMKLRRSNTQACLKRCWQLAADWPGRMVSWCEDGMHPTQHSLTARSTDPDAKGGGRVQGPRTGKRSTETLKA